MSYAILFLFINLTSLIILNNMFDKIFGSASTKNSKLSRVQKPFQGWGLTKKQYQSAIKSKIPTSIPSKKSQSSSNQQGLHNLQGQYGGWGLPPRIQNHGQSNQNNPHYPQPQAQGGWGAPYRQQPQIQGGWVQNKWSQVQGGWGGQNLNNQEQKVQGGWGLQQNNQEQVQGGWGLPLNQQYKEQVLKEAQIENKEVLKDEGKLFNRKQQNQNKGWWGEPNQPEDKRQQLGMANNVGGGWGLNKAELQLMNKIQQISIENGWGRGRLQSSEKRNPVQDNRKQENQGWELRFPNVEERKMEEKNQRQMQRREIEVEKVRENQRKVGETPIGWGLNKILEFEGKKQAPQYPQLQKRQKRLLEPAKIPPGNLEMKYPEVVQQQIAAQIQRSNKQQKEVKQCLHDQKQKEGKEQKARPKLQADDQSMLCVICLDKPRNCLSTQCFHLVCCFECASGQALCPICRAKMIPQKVYI